MGLDQASTSAYYSSGVGVSNVSAQSRTLASALHRLRLIAFSLEQSNDRTTQFLDALVGPSLKEGQDTGAATPQEVSFVAELHRIVDRLDDASTITARRSYALLAAADDPTQQGEASKSDGAEVLAERERQMNHQLGGRQAFGVSSGRIG